MKAVAFVGGLVVIAGLVFLAVAGLPGAVPLMVTAVALVAMIGLGSVMGGRRIEARAQAAVKTQDGNAVPIAVLLIGQFAPVRHGHRPGHSGCTVWRPRSWPGETKLGSAVFA